MDTPTFVMFISIIISETPFKNPRSTTELASCTVVLRGIDFFAKINISVSGNLRVAPDWPGQEYCMYVPSLNHMQLGRAD